MRAGKLNEKILKLFIATGQDEVLSFIEELNIQPIIAPVLPTRKSSITIYPFTHVVVAVQHVLV